MARHAPIMAPLAVAALAAIIALTLPLANANGAHGGRADSGHAHGGRAAGGNAAGGNAAGGNAAGGKAAGTYDCAQPCPEGVAPACGKDGFSYQHECLAICQGVEVERRGLCPGDKLDFKDAKAGALNPSTRDRFKPEGFKYFGKLGIEVAAGPPNEEPLKPEEQAKAKAASDAMGKKARAPVIMTPEGDAYISDPDTQAARKLDEHGEHAKATKVSAGKHIDGAVDNATAAEAGRKLRYVIAPDSRVQRFQPVAWPLTAVGQLQFPVSGGVATCSGAMISTRAVLTAAHCVHGGPGSNWYGGLQYIPMRTCGNTACTGTNAEPHGRIDWFSMMTYLAWINNRDYRYDIAVVQLPYYIGHVTGWFGFTYGPVAGTMTSAGYPGDKPFGSLWRQDNYFTVDDWDKLMYDSVTDVVPGQSGSALWDANLYIRGVVSHTWGCPSTCYQADVTTRCCGNSNGYVQLDAEHFNNILAWR